jgi:hypothetical protein
MSKYPSASTLKTKLETECSGDNTSEFCQAVANKFGDQPFACDHRVPQTETFKIGKAMKMDAETCSKAAALICSLGNCGKK